MKRTRTYLVSSIQSTRSRPSPSSLASACGLTTSRTEGRHRRQRRGLTPHISSGHATAGFACRGMPLMSNVMRRIAAVLHHEALPEFTRPCPEYPELVQRVGCCPHASRYLWASRSTGSRVKGSLHQLVQQIPAAALQCRGRTREDAACFPPRGGLLRFAVLVPSRRWGKHH